MQFAYLLVIAVVASRVRGDCVLDIQQGRLRGSTWTTLHGKDFCSYQGIPYAAPPVGDLRFRAPRPPSGWEGERNATKAGHMCLQKVLSMHLGSEDCLYLNVFTTQTAEPTTELLPVLVFIHGGTYTLGSGNPISYGPHYLLDNGVVMVTINYRLGVVGFLSTGDDASPGNYALKDQVQALRWIQDNIAQFGGDPGKVTVMGESAGAWSVHYHILSPLSAGLFHGGIANSGSALMPLAFQTDPLPVARKKAEAAGCPTDTTQHMIDCMRALDINVLMESEDPGDSGPVTRTAMPSLGSSLYNVIWTPVVEAKTADNPEPFLTDHPRNVITSGQFNKVPLLIGTNSEEGSLFVVLNIGTQAVLDDLNSDFQQLEIPFFLSKSFKQEEIPEALEKITDFYLGTNHTVTPSNVHLLIDAMSDRFMNYNILKSVQLHLKSGHDNIYLYNFAYRGKYSVLAKARYTTGKYDLGVIHLDELEYLLSSGYSTDKWEAGHPDLEVLEAAVTLWTNFVKFGNPTPPGERMPQDVTWPTAGAQHDKLSFYVFSNSNPPVKPLKLSVQADKFKDRVAFWDSLNLAENNV